MTITTNHLFTANKTKYAIGLGYTGRKPVIVCDGRVITHGGQDSHEFMQRVRQGQRQRSNPSQSRHNVRRFRRADARFSNQFCKPATTSQNPA